MRKLSISLVVILACAALLSACGSDSDSDAVEAAVTLPAPQVWVGLLPTFTPVLEEATPQPESTAAPTSAPQAQAWPTMTDEEYEDYMLGVLDDMLNRIERKLNNTDTEIRP